MGVHATAGGRPHPKPSTWPHLRLRRRDRRPRRRRRGPLQRPPPRRQLQRHGPERHAADGPTGRRSRRHPEHTMGTGRQGQPPRRRRAALMVLPPARRRGRRQKGRRHSRRMARGDDRAHAHPTTELTPTGKGLQHRRAQRRSVVRRGGVGADDDHGGHIRLGRDRYGADPSARRGHERRAHGDRYGARLAAGHRTGHRPRGTAHTAGSAHWPERWMASNPRAHKRRRDVHSPAHARRRTRTGCPRTIRHGATQGRRGYRDNLHPTPTCRGPSGRPTRLPQHTGTVRDGAWKTARKGP